MPKISSVKKHLNIKDPLDFSYFYILNLNPLACLKVCLLLFHNCLCLNHYFHLIIKYRFHFE